MPPLLTTRPGTRLHDRGVEPVARPADELRMGEHRVADRRQRIRERGARIAGRDGRRGPRAIAYARATSRSGKA